MASAGSSSDSFDTLAFFVYGTLQRGEERERCWPHRPIGIEIATTRGCLYDLGPYPAMAHGDDSVLGELWYIGREHVQETLDALDAIECYGQDDVDLYVREVVECTNRVGSVIAAYAYFLADEAALKSRQRVHAASDGYCRWHRFRD